MGNTNRSSLPNLDGIPLFCGWEPLRWSGCLSAVPGIHLASSWDGSKGGCEVGGDGDGSACVALYGLSSRGRARRTVSQPCGPGKVRRVRLDQCACPAVWLLWSVLSVRGEVERASLPLFRGFLEKHTSKCCPLKLLCGEHHGITLSTAWRWLVEQVVFLSGDFRGLRCGELLELFLIVTRSLANCFVWRYSGKIYSMWHRGTKQGADFFKMYTCIKHELSKLRLQNCFACVVKGRRSVSEKYLMLLSIEIKTSSFRFSLQYYFPSWCSQNLSHWD